MKNLYFLFTFLCCTSLVSAQYQIELVPRISPDRSVSETIGYTKIDIQYSSPSVNNREVWGNLVPYDEVWRAGANNATTIDFSERVEINGHALDKGRYAFFVIPRETDKWTVIFNKKSEQWGAFSYHEKDDVLRIDILPMRNPHTEKLTYSIESLGFKHCHIFLEWEQFRLALEVKTDYLEIFREKVEEKIAQAPDNTQWVVYLQGADYLASQNENLDLAYKWIQKSEALSKIEAPWHPQYYPRSYILGHLYWVKANILAQRSDYMRALEYAQKMKDIKGPNSFYEEERAFENIDEIIELWLDLYSAGEN